ncbi:hypothetical protein HanPSC8_Chr11g0467211 [Helianthus annuus]|nr:hypothetical protein HanPSC8_Chr11g0467211 [Helianthus annuus]
MRIIRSVQNRSMLDRIHEEYKDTSFSKPIFSRMAWIPIPLVPSVPHLNKMGQVHSAIFTVLNVILVLK